MEKSNFIIELQPIENEGPSQNRSLRDIGDLTPRQTRDSFMDILEGNTQSKNVEDITVITDSDMSGVPMPLN